MVLVFAVVVSYFPVDPNLIKPVNAVIKALSVAIGAFIALKGGKGAIKGIVFGAIYFVLSFLLFGAIAGGLDFSYKLLFDLLLCAIAGGTVGVVKVNAK